MRQVALADQLRAADRSAVDAVGEGVLIERAAAAVAAVATELLGAGGGVYGADVLVLAGSGHNGADALRAGARLAGRGAAVRVLRSSSRPGDEQVTAAERAVTRAGGRPTDAVGEPDLVIDGMTGGGGRGALRGRAAELAAAVLGHRVLAVDLASGVDADTGAADGAAVRAEVTVTFGALRPGHLVGAGADLAGSVVVADIGLRPAPGPVAVLDADDVAPLYADPAEQADKYTRGVVGVRAGGAAYPGAAVLATGGAVRAGAGYVRYLGAAADAVRAAWPTVVVGAGRVDCWVLGPGLELGGDGDGDEEGAELEAVRAVLASDTPAVLDAGALAVGASALRGRTAPTLITPHAGEFQRLTGTDPGADPLGAARAAAADLGVHVLLKGQRTVVAAPDGRARVNPTATTWLSTAGTGDVLSGACGALLAAAVKRGGPDLLTVAAAAAFLHGLAGRYARLPLAATDLLDAWAQAVAAVRSPG